MVKLAKSTEETEEIMLMKIFKTLLAYSTELDKQYFELLTIKITHLENMFKLKKCEEPIRFLKEKHKKWQEEIDLISKKIYDTYETIGDEIHEQIDFQNKIKTQKNSTIK